MPFARLDAVIAEVAGVADRLRHAGHRVYLVGGVVRDLWLDREISADVDLDLTTDATPEQIHEIVAPVAHAIWLQGARFGTVGVRVGNRDFEITTHRSEVYPESSRKPVVRFSTAIEEDLSRRDFTVNAMAVELPGAELVDPFGGIGDLEAARLRTPLDPAISFGDDPLRMLRAARFCAGYDLVPAEPVVSAMSSMRERMQIVSAERIRDELDKLLALPDPSAGLALLARTGLLGEILPEVDPSTVERRGPSIGTLDPDPALRLAALLHGLDLDTARERLWALRSSNERSRQILEVLDAVGELATGAVDDAPSLRRWAARAGPQRDRARALVEAVVPDGATLATRSRELEDQLGEDLSDLAVPLSGAEVMAVLGIGEGPEVGEALAFLHARRLERGPMTAAGAEQQLRAWWSERRSGG